MVIYVYTYASCYLACYVSLYVFMNLYVYIYIYYIYIHVYIYFSDVYTCIQTRQSSGHAGDSWGGCLHLREVRVLGPLSQLGLVVGAQVLLYVL